MSIPYVPQGTSKRFRVPRTLAADFNAFLNRDIPNTNMDFEILKCWYDKDAEDYVPVYIRGEVYPDATKSRYENTDNMLNIRCAVDSGIQQGDMLIREDGSIYVLDWEVNLQSNNAPSRMLRCNMYLNVKRHVINEENYDEDGYKMYDENGFVIHDGGIEEVNTDDPWVEIVPPIPCNAYRYDGRPEYVVVSGTPGAIANALTILTVQYNEYTDKIHIDDIFKWGDEVYRIVDVNRVDVNINHKWGTIKLQAKKAEGGLSGY